MICVSPARRKVRQGKPTENGLEFHFSTKITIREPGTLSGNKPRKERRRLETEEGRRRKEEAKKDGSRKKRAVPPIRGTAQNRICYVHSKHKKHARSLQRREMARSRESVIEMRPQKTRQERDSRMHSGRTVKALLRLNRHSAAATEPQMRRRNPAVDAAVAQPRKSSGSTTEARP